MRPDDPRHGSYAGAQKHRKDNEPLCDPCREALNAYMANYRKSHPAARQKGRAYSVAYHRALSRLANEHRDRFWVLLDEETGKEPAA